MAAQVEFDLDLIDSLIEREEATLEPTRRVSIEYRATADRYVAGGVASSWQDSPPHAIFIDRGKENRLWTSTRTSTSTSTSGTGRWWSGTRTRGSSRRSSARPSSEPTSHSRRSTST